MARKTRIVIGLNSGTSADGVDATAVEITGRGLAMCVRIVGHIHFDYHPDLRRRVLAAMAPAPTTTAEICRLDAEIGDAFADAAVRAVKKFGLRKELTAVGSHGQTICHLPPRHGKARPAPRGGSSRANGTMQIGDASRIAVRLDCPVVHGFRQADMAVGGQGAPLVPWTDYVLFRDRSRTRVIQNIGGIANLTCLPAGAGPESVVAFDTGPGNMIMDAMMRRFTRGRAHFDADGRMAAKGACDARALATALHHPFFDEPPPRSGGREEFGEDWTRRWMKQFAARRLRPADWLRTAACLTAFTIALGCRDAQDAAPRRSPARKPAPIAEIILCGGGANNLTLVSELRAAIVSSLSPSTQISLMDDYGIASEAKESLSFAMLAAARLDGVPANLPQVTGAKRPVVLGAICETGAAR